MVTELKRIFGCENKDLILGGDFNSDIREGEIDVLRSMIRDTMIRDLGMTITMTVTGTTHQEVC